MAFKSFYSAYSQIVIASVAFLLVVALVCGAAAIGFFSSLNFFVVFNFYFK